MKRAFPDHQANLVDLMEFFDLAGFTKHMKQTVHETSRLDLSAL